MDTNVYDCLIGLSGFFNDTSGGLETIKAVGFESSSYSFWKYRAPENVEYGGN